MKHNKKYTAKELKAEIETAENNLTRAKMKLEYIKNQYPIGHSHYFNSNHDEMEFISFRGSKKSLRKWIKDLQKLYFPKK